MKILWFQYLNLICYLICYIQLAILCNLCSSKLNNIGTNAYTEESNTTPKYNQRLEWLNIVNDSSNYGSKATALPIRPDKFERESIGRSAKHEQHFTAAGMLLQHPKTDPVHQQDSSLNLPEINIASLNKDNSKREASLMSVDSVPTDKVFKGSLLNHVPESKSTGFRTESEFDSSSQVKREESLVPKMLTSSTCHRKLNPLLEDLNHTLKKIQSRLDSLLNVKEDEGDSNKKLDKNLRGRNRLHKEMKSKKSINKDYDKQGNSKKSTNGNSKKSTNKDYDKQSAKKRKKNAPHAKQDETFVEHLAPGLPDCSKETNIRHPVLVVSTLDGHISGISYKTGEVLWSHMTSTHGHPLFSSSLSKLEVSSRGKWIQLIPSLDGGIYRFDGENVEALPVTVDSLLHSSLKFNEDTIFTGGKFTEIIGIDPNTGDVKYVCNSGGCPTTKHEAMGSEQLLVVRRESQTVRAIDPQTGHERWNFSVGNNDLNLATSDCESIFKNSHTELQPPSLHIHLAEGYISAMNSESQVLWRQEFSSPIVSGWSLLNNELSPVDVFKAPLIPTHHPTGTPSSATEDLSPGRNSQRKRQPELYMGVYHQQLYIQQNKNYKPNPNFPLRRFIGPVQMEEMNKVGSPKLKLLPYTTSVIDQRMDRPTPLLDFERKAPPTTSDVIVYQNSDQIFGHGYFLFGVDEEEFVEEGDHFNSSSTDDLELEEEISSFNDHIHIFCFELGPSIWMKVAAVLGIYSILHLLIVRYLFIRLSSDLRVEMHRRIMTILHRLGIDRLPLPHTPESDKLPQLPPLDKDAQQQKSNFSSRYRSDFEPVSCLGKGGFGVVFQVKNKLDENEYAIKRIVLPSKEQRAERVKREVRALAKLNHSNIVRYYNSWLETPPPGWEQEADAWWRNSETFSNSIVTSYAEDNSEHQIKAKSKLQLQTDTSHSKSNHPSSFLVKSLNVNQLSLKMGSKWSHADCSSQLGPIHNSLDSYTSKDYEEESGHCSDSDSSGSLEESKDIQSSIRAFADEDSLEICFEDTPGPGDGKNGDFAIINDVSLSSQSSIHTHSKCTSKTADLSNCEDISSLTEQIVIKRSKNSLSVSSGHFERRKENDFKKDRWKLKLNVNKTKSIIQSKNIQKITEEFGTVASSPRTYLYIQMELCQKETLKDWLFSNPQRENSLMYSMFNEIVLAVEYVHERSLMHRDLKPSNIFFSLNGEIKIGDFGLATKIKEDDLESTDSGAATPSLVVATPDESFADNSALPPHQRTLNVGTHLYMSPEQMCGHSYTYKVDIFSLGLIFFEMLVPFTTEMERRTVMLRVRENVFPQQFVSDNPDVVNLLRLTLHPDPNERLTTRGIRARDPLSPLQSTSETITQDEHFTLTRIKGHTRSYSGSFSTSSSAT